MEKLEIIKVHNCAAAKGKLADLCEGETHPSAEGVDDLLSLKITEPRTKANQRQVDLANTNQAIDAWGYERLSGNRRRPCFC